MSLTYSWDSTVHRQCRRSGKPEVRSSILRGQLPAGVYDGFAYPDTHRSWGASWCWGNGGPLPTECGGIFLFPITLVAVAWGYCQFAAVLRLVVAGSGLGYVYILDVLFTARGGCRIYLAGPPVYIFYRFAAPVDHSVVAPVCHGMGGWG